MKKLFMFSMMTAALIFTDTKEVEAGPLGIFGKNRASACASASQANACTSASACGQTTQVATAQVTVTPAAPKAIVPPTPVTPPVTPVIPVAQAPVVQVPVVQACAPSTMSTSNVKVRARIGLLGGRLRVRSNSCN